MGKNQFWAREEEGNPVKYLSVFYPTRVEILMFVLRLFFIRDHLKLQYSSAEEMFSTV